MATRFLFVCSGNITRSPVAAALADQIGMGLAMDLEVRSAGTLGISDQPAHPRMVAAARQIGLDLTPHRSQGLTPELCAWADRIVVMEPHHAETVHQMCPDMGDRVIHLGPLLGLVGIDDPTGSWRNGPYRDTRDEIRRAVTRLLASTPTET